MMPSCALKRASAFLLPVTRFGGFSFLGLRMDSNQELKSVLEVANITEPVQCDDYLMEQDIQALNLTAPRVESASIDDIMSRVRYVVSVVEGTTTTLATAVTDDGFTLAIGQTSCVDPDNFNASVGAKWAIEDAKKKARDELWKLEGWRLKRELTQGKVKQ